MKNITPRINPNMVGKVIHISEIKPITPVKKNEIVKLPKKTIKSKFISLFV